MESFYYLYNVVKVKDMIPKLEPNEFFRINSYYWQGMVYIALETTSDAGDEVKEPSVFETTTSYEPVSEIDTDGRVNVLVPADGFPIISAPFFLQR